ncbi:hypothetical protein [Pedobacter mendelii]|nr:hypothetical protein [Pedobacter mendelii]
MIAKFFKVYFESYAGIAYALTGDHHAIGLGATIARGAMVYP